MRPYIAADRELLRGGLIARPSSYWSRSISLKHCDISAIPKRVQKNQGQAAESKSLQEVNRRGVGGASAIEIR